MADLRVQDRMELRLLAEQYARGADTRDAVLYADVFTDDAVLVTNRGEIRGREQLLTIAPKLGRYEVTMHFVGNHHVVFDDADTDRASGQVLCTAEHVYTDDDVRRVYVMKIRYHDDYRRTPAGWRIQNRSLELLWDDDRPLGSR
ncbi:MAG: nuclear transport factor 2 family protein [Acidimicrobiales bacterium]|nr:nuclear transport factor 2 family protein [Acidimicrobiales bacterium]